MNPRLTMCSFCEQALVTNVELPRLQPSPKHAQKYAHHAFCEIVFLEVARETVRCVHYGVNRTPSVFPYVRLGNHIESPCLQLETARHKQQQPEKGECSQLLQLKAFECRRFQLPEIVVA